MPAYPGVQLHLDYRALGDVLRSTAMRNLMTETAQALAQELGNRGVDRVWVNAYTTDRAAASVTIPEHSVDREIRDGLLTNAATAIGLEVRQRG